MSNLGGVNGFGVNGSGSEESLSVDVGFGEFNQAELNVLSVNGPDFLSVTNSFALISIYQSIVWYLAAVKIINVNQNVLLRSTFSSNFLLEIHQNIKFIWN